MTHVKVGISLLCILPPSLPGEEKGKEGKEGRRKGRAMKIIPISNNTNTNNELPEFDRELIA
ncbi:hypothetical protein ACTHTR_10955, partial [Neisseria sp. P0018.S004]|uniref:hypothetical protein n=1 Tax=Neisseria sp. P0018.S004 TaxID=3436790 RepID=UPI003F8161C6